MCLDMVLDGPPAHWNGKFYKVVATHRDGKGNKTYWTGLFAHVETLHLKVGVKVYNSFKREIICNEDLEDQYTSGFHCLLFRPDAEKYLADMQNRVVWQGKPVANYALVEVLAEDLTFGTQNGWPAVSAQEITVIQEVE